MDHIVTYIEGSKVVEGELLRLFYGPAQGYPVEAVEDFVVGVAAGLAFVVYETLMYAAAGDEFGLRASFFIENGADSVALSLLFAKYDKLVAVFDFCAYIGYNQFEVFVEYGLRGQIEYHLLFILPLDRHIEIYPAEISGEREEFPFLIHI